MRHVISSPSSLIELADEVDEILHILCGGAYGHDR